MLHGDDWTIDKGSDQENMAEMMLLLKPGLFIVKSVGDPVQLYQDFVKYISNFQEFLTATDAAGAHTVGHDNCGACQGDIKACRRG